MTSERNMLNSDMDPVMEQIVLRLQMQNKSQTELCDYIGISRCIFTRWKYDHGMSFYNYLDKIAEFLGGSRNDLLNEKVSINPEIKSGYDISKNEYDFIEKYRMLSSSRKKLILQLINSYLE